MMLNLMDSYTLFFLAHPFKALAIQSIGLERSKRSLPRAASFFYEHLIFFLVGRAGEDLCRIFVQVLGYLFTCLQHCMGAFCKGGNRSRERKVLGSQMAENRITSSLREFSPSSMTKSWRVGEVWELEANCLHPTSAAYQLLPRANCSTYSRLGFLLCKRDK